MTKKLKGKKTKASYPKGKVNKKTGKRSGLEDSLDKVFRKHKLKYVYEAVKMPYTIIQNRSYIPDFIIDVKKGKVLDSKSSKNLLTIDELKGMLIIEAKGYFRVEDRIKMSAVKETYPEVDIRFIFSNDGFVTKKSAAQKKNQAQCKKDGIKYVDPRKRYSDWCEEHEFPYAIGEYIPEEWLKV